MPEKFVFIAKHRASRLPDMNGISGDESPSVDPRERAAEFDTFFLKIKTDMATGYGVDAEIVRKILEDHDDFIMTQFVDAYRSGGRYPIERLNKVMYKFFDVKLQIEIVRTHFGLVNQTFVLPGIVQPARRGSARLTLVDVALKQALFGSIRICWERLMQAVYFLEEGKEISGKSIKVLFFNWADTKDQWRFLVPYRKVVVAHDDAFRTPEFHKGSILRKQVFGAPGPDPNDVV